jgi:transcriptional regulator with XRE-family HTH domain
VSILYLGLHLRRLREAAGLGTRELADRTGIAHSRVDAIEAGAKDVTLLEVAALAAVFGYTVDDVWAAIVELIRSDGGSSGKVGTGEHRD